MKLTHIDLQQLHPSNLNVRKKGVGDVTSLTSSIRAIGLIQPLLVRAKEDGFEVIAGQRRLAALTRLNEEGPVEPVPCAVLEDGDDARAIEASLAENIERLPMDEIDQYHAFAELIGEGLSVGDVASHFGVTERLVQQRLAIAKLDKRILKLYREEEITGDTVRALTLASPAQQKAWLQRHRDPSDYAPTGRQLRQWLLGGAQISTKAALFPVETYRGAIVTDLFGEDSYFADSGVFWTMQNSVIEERTKAYREAGWCEVVVLDPAGHFPDWDYRKLSKKQGGKVFIAPSFSGEVEFHEGLITEREARANEVKVSKQEAEVDTVDKGAQLSHAARNYIDLHRHAAVRAALIGKSDVVLRLVTAHLIAGSTLWNVAPEKCKADKPATEVSVEASISYKVFDAERTSVLEDLPVGEEGRVVAHGWKLPPVQLVFSRLIPLSDDEVMRILALAMGETLAVGTPLIEDLGSMLGVDMGKLWQADEAFLSLIVKRDALLPMLESIAPQDTYDAHKDSPGKTIRSVILNLATGEGREKVEGWVPEQMQFAPDDDAASQTDQDDAAA